MSVHDGNPLTAWRRLDGDSRPPVRKAIIILTEDARVMRGYMGASQWPGETKLTYSFHGEYYDFKKSKLSYCLVNAIGWMPLPEVPRILESFEALREQELAREGKTFED